MKLFPLQESTHDMKLRQHEKYKVIRSFGKRYAISPIPSMQKLLNKQKEALKSLLSPTNYAL